MTFLKLLGKGKGKKKKKEEKKDLFLGLKLS